MMSFDDVLEGAGALLAVIGVLISVGLLILGVMVVIRDADSPTFTLSKSRWKCTATDTRTVMQPVFAGKTTTLIPQSVTECIEYSAR